MSAGNPARASDEYPSIRRSGQGRGRFGVISGRTFVFRNGGELAGHPPCPFFAQCHAGRWRKPAGRYRRRFPPRDIVVVMVFCSTTPFIALSSIQRLELLEQLFHPFKKRHWPCGAGSLLQRGFDYPSCSSLGGRQHMNCRHCPPPPRLVSVADRMSWYVPDFPLEIFSFRRDEEPCFHGLF